MFGGDLFRAAWLAAGVRAKEACLHIASGPKMPGDLGSVKAETPRMFSMTECDAAKDRAENNYGR